MFKPIRKRLSILLGRSVDPVRLLRSRPLLLNRAWYLEAYPDVAAAGSDPAEHYALVGWREGRDPNPFFSTRWYLEANPDVRAAGINPLVHFISDGWREGRDPSPRFSLAEYLRQNPGLLATGANPLEDFLQRSPLSLGSTSAGLDEDLLREIRDSGLFHEGWYRAAYPDVAPGWPNVLEHFVRHGIHENRRPNPYVDPPWYTKQWLSGARNDTPPLLHYLRDGWRKGCDPSQRFSLQHYRELTGWTPKDGEPLKEFLRRGLPGTPPLPAVIVQRPTYYVAVGTKNAQPYYQGTFLRYAVDHRPAGQHTASRPFNPSRLNLHWIIPDFSSGGGGHMTIFRMVRALSLRGHQQTVWVHGYGHASGDHAFDDIVKHYQTLNAKVLRIEEADITHARADAVIATDWASVFIAQSMEATKRVFYFVQDYEPYFYPRGSEALLAESTYEADVDCLCASPWLANKMSQTFGRWARGFHLASDLDVYHPGHSRTNAHSTGGAPRIAFYARSFTARRAVELGLLALEELARRGERFVVDVFGAETSVETAPFPFVNHGVLTPEQLAELYRASTIGVVFSATNYSLVPQEMMASGLPVVDLDVESTRAIYPPNVVTFAKPNPIAIADALQHLLRDAERRGDQREAALNWVSQFSWSGAADVVELSIVGRLRELGHVASPAIQSMTSTAPKASVVIPTWNGGQLLLDVLERVKQQVHVDAFEIIVIDSGSNDGTLEVMQADERILLHRIKQSDFGHGKTRNLGVELSRGEYVAFLTQDAMPASTTWLADYVLLLDHFPHAGGAFGRHLAWPSASPFTKRDINAHFEQFFHHPIAVSKDTNRERWDADDPSWRQLLHYYSDNNSCLRRSVWAKIPYRDVAYGEDQLFAHDIVSAGYQKVFAPGAVVYHSHDYDEAQTFERSRIEAAFFKQFFGYILMDDEGTLKKVLEGINGSDMQWARAHGVGEAELERQLRLNEARLRGYLAGDRSVGRVQERRRG